MQTQKENEVKVVNIRMVREPSLYSTDPISSPQDVLDVIANELKDYDREVFAICRIISYKKPNLIFMNSSSAFFKDKNSLTFSRKSSIYC